MKNYIYLDNNATTQLDPVILETMEKELRSPPSNPSSNHFLGKKAKLRLLQAKNDISSCLNIKPDEIIFTSGGTESLNLLIRGISKTKKNSHIITTDIEHACVHNTILNLEKDGYKVSYIKTGLKGAPSIDQIKNEITGNTSLIVLSAVNSETGVLIDLEEVAALALENNIQLVIDGVGLLGKKKFDIPPGISAMGFSSHKIHGPKGVGFIYLSSNCDIIPMLLGGPQENHIRAGTENLPGIIATAKAVELAYQNIDENIKKMESLRDFFEKTLDDRLTMKINGENPRVCNTSNISFLGLDAEDILMQLDIEKVLASHGSACQSGISTLSRVLLNMGLGRDRSRSSIRFSLSKFTTKEEIEKAINIIEKAIKNLS